MQGFEIERPGVDVEAVAGQLSCLPVLEVRLGCRPGHTRNPDQIYQAFDECILVERVEDACFDGRELGDGVTP